MKDIESLRREQKDQKKPFDPLHTVKDVGGQVKNTLNDIVSVLKGYYEGGERPDEQAIIRKTLESEKTPEYWKDWRWQLRHAYGILLYSNNTRDPF